MQHKLKMGLIFILVMIVAVVIFQNTETTTLELFIWEVEASRIVVFGGFTVLGFIVGCLTVWIISHSWRKHHPH